MYLLVGNWKMAPEKESQAIELTKKTLAIARLYKKDLSFVVCPPFIHIPAVSKVAKAALSFGAQSVSKHEEVAHTGSVNAAMLKSYNASYCIVGHSEMRAQGETNHDVAEKVLRLLEKRIIPIICIGEHGRDTQGWYLSEVKDQIESVLSVIPDAALKKIIIAYEPVWAIGKDATRQATALECEEMIIFIRKMIADHANEKIAALVPILYGGSVDELNVHQYISEGKVQGLLVGRVSLDAKRYAALAKAIVQKK